MASGAGKAATTPAQAPPAKTQLSIKNVWEPPPVWSGRGCAHLTAWLETPTWKQDYKAVLQFVNSARLQKLTRETVLQKGTTVCFKCGEGPLRRLYVSLHSPYVGCKEGGCMQAHASASKHALGMDMQRGEVYCFECKDFVYDRLLEEERTNFLDKITRANDRVAETSTPEKKQRMHDDGPKSGSIAKHCLPRRSDWIPTPEQVQVLKNQAKPPEPEAGIAGLRGMHNLGNTCFLNCVLQGLVHNPGVRDYFLGDYHNRHRCKLKREQAGQLDHVCMACEMDKLVEECFQGSKTAFSPHSFLFGMWKSSQHLAGYEQQDAHECFISVLDEIQKACNDDLTEDGRDGKAILMRLFRGVMRSDVTCLECKASKATKDPFLDISLDLSQDAVASAVCATAAAAASSASASAPKTVRQGEACDGPLNDSNAPAGQSLQAEKEGGRKQEGQQDRAPHEGGGPTPVELDSAGAGGGHSGKAVGGAESGSSVEAAGSVAASAPGSASIALEDCLWRFTAVEKLDQSSQWQCEDCKSGKSGGGGASQAREADAAGQEAGRQRGGIKQLSIQMLAPSLCVQLKRFESACFSGSQQSNKIDTHVKFPLRLNLSPYVSDSVIKRGKQWLEDHTRQVGDGQPPGRAGGHVSDEGVAPIWYALYAVVVHHGRMDSGHYSAFVRRGKDWFSCDDSAIVLVSEQQVLDCQAYLLYYISCEQ